MEKFILNSLICVLIFVVIFFFFAILNPKMDKQIGPVGISWESNTSLRKRCLEKGYQDFAVTEDKLFCTHPNMLSIPLEK